MISFSYRLAPQHPYPAALQDCSTVVRHILEFGDSPDYLIDPQRVALAGDSAGEYCITGRYFNISPYSLMLQAEILLQFFRCVMPQIK